MTERELRERIVEAYTQAHGEPPPEQLVENLIAQARAEAGQL